MSTLIEDSDRRCPHCSKRMMLDVGQDETTGWTRMIHHCWSCDYREIDENWPRPRLTLVSLHTAAERLLALRLGREIPMVYDQESLPQGERMNRTPMKRRHRSTGPDVDTIELVLARAGYCCEACDDSLHRGYQIHHRRPRQMGGTRWDGANLPCNLLALCGFCHADVESRRAHAQDMGRLVPNVSDPATVAVLVAQHWVYLTSTGEYSDNPPVKP